MQCMYKKNILHNRHRFQFLHISEICCYALRTYKKGENPIKLQSILNLSEMFLNSSERNIHRFIGIVGVNYTEIKNKHELVQIIIIPAKYFAWTLRLKVLTKKKMRNIQMHCTRRMFSTPFSID